eukprot:806121-Amphidinium_carterae.1
MDPSLSCKNKGSKKRNIPKQCASIGGMLEEGYGSKSMVSFGSPAWCTKASRTTARQRIDPPGLCLN